MKNLTKLFLLVACSIVIVSCTKVVDYDLGTIEEKTVIEGRIIKDSFALVRVTKTAKYLENKSTPIVSNAFIVISNNQGGLDTLDHVGNGYYKGDLIIGNTTSLYTLSVKSEGKDYVASTRILETVPFQITGYIYKDGKGFDDEGYYPTIKTTLPPDSYYLFNYYKNGKLYRDEPSDVFVTDSKFIGTEIDGVDTPYPYQINDVAKLNIYRINKEGFDFYNSLGAQLVNDGGFFSTPPSNTSTNFSNGAIGLFMGASLYSQSVTIAP